jgi:hypothetical protein
MRILGFFYTTFEALYWKKKGEKVILNGVNFKNIAPIPMAFFEGAYHILGG